MPERRKGEPLKRYIKRFADSGEAKRSFPDIKQRIAVAYSMGRKRGRS
jgi:hypothetical protein